MENNHYLVKGYDCYRPIEESLLEIASFARTRLSLKLRIMATARPSLRIISRMRPNFIGIIRSRQSLKKVDRARPSLEIFARTRLNLWNSEPESERQNPSVVDFEFCFFIVYRA